MKTINIKLSEEDLFTRNLDLFLHTSWGRESINKYLIGILGYIVFVSAFIGVLFEKFVFFIICFLLLSLLYLFQAKFKVIEWAAKIIAREQIKYLKKGSFDKLLEPRTIEIADDYISISSDYFVSKMQWDYYKSVKKTPSHIFIYDNQLSSIMVPRSAFVSDSDFESFFDTLSSFI